MWSIPVSYTHLNQRGALCSGLSHEIYQALSAIRASSGLLRQAMDKESPQACGQLGWVFENIDQSTLRLSRVAENLQDLLQAERGTFAPRLEALDLVGQYSEAMEMCIRDRYSCVHLPDR